MKAILHTVFQAMAIFAITVIAQTSSSNNGTFRVGAARVDISPAVNPYWEPLDEFDLEKLHVRAVVFENKGITGALITADLSHIEEEVYQHAASLVAATLNTTVDHIIISAIHTHSSTIAGQGLGINGNVVYGNTVINGFPSLGDAAATAAEQAAARLQPAKVGFATGSAYNNVNRDQLDPVTGRWTQAGNLTGPVDREVQVLSFLSTNNTPIAAYTSYAMHPVQSYLNGYTSADWPGAMTRWVERSFGGDFVALYSQSASGDVNPLCRRTGSNVLASIGGLPITGMELNAEPVEEPIRDMFIPIVRPDIFYTRQLFQQLTALGITVGEEVIRVISHTTDWNNDPTIWGAQRNATCPGRLRIDTAREGVQGTYTSGPDVDIRTSVVGFGDVVVAGVGAEIFTRIGWKIKEASSLKKTMLVTLANGKSTSGYIPDSLSFDQETFQVLGTKLQPGTCPETNISSTIADLVSEFKPS